MHNIFEKTMPSIEFFYKTDTVIILSKQKIKLTKDFCVVPSGEKYLIRAVLTLSY
jgi:hypothetical protein